MADDLDDGELWLPSDIVPDVGRRDENDRLLLHHHHRRRRSLLIPADLAAMDDLAARLAASGIAPYNPPPPPPESEFLSRFLSARERLFWSASRAHRIAAAGGFPAPNRTLDGQMEELGARRWGGRVSCWMGENWNSPPERFFFPVRAAAGAAAPPRDHGGGTGVFLPRVAAPAAANGEAKLRSHIGAQNNSNNSSGRSSWQHQKQQQQEHHLPRRNALVGRQENMPFHQPPPHVMDLPLDWTY